MSYIGLSPVAGKFQKIDDISSGFNDSTTTFNVQSNGENVDIGVAEQLLVSIDGVLQQPTSAYTASGSSITFTEAPNTNASFFAILLGETGTVSLVTPTDGSVTESKLGANAVTHTKLAADAVGTPQIKNTEVTAAKLATDAVETAKIKDVNVTTAKIANDAVTSLKISPNTILRGKTVFDAAIQERSNIISSNIGPEVITIDPLNNSILFYTANSHDNTAHTVNFINLENIQVGNAVSFVVAVTNNVDSQANINAVQVNGATCITDQLRTTTSNNLFISGGPAVPTGSANIDVYSFNVQKVQTSSYTVFLSKTNFS